MRIDACRCVDPLARHNLRIAPLTTAQHEVADPREIDGAQTEAASAVWQAVERTLKPRGRPNAYRLEQLARGKGVDALVGDFTHNATGENRGAAVIRPLTSRRSKHSPIEDELHPVVARAIELVEWRARVWLLVEIHARAHREEIAQRQRPLVVVDIRDRRIAREDIQHRSIEGERDRLLLVRDAEEERRDTLRHRLHGVRLVARPTDVLLEDDESVADDDNSMKRAVLPASHVVAQRRQQVLVDTGSARWQRAPRVSGKVRLSRIGERNGRWFSGWPRTRDADGDERDRRSHRSAVAPELQGTRLRAALPVLIRDLAIDLMNAIDDRLRRGRARRRHFA